MFPCGSQSKEGDTMSEEKSCLACIEVRNRRRNQDDLCQRCYENYLGAKK